MKKDKLPVRFSDCWSWKSPDVLRPAVVHYPLQNNLNRQIICSFNSLPVVSTFLFAMWPPLTGHANIETQTQARVDGCTQTGRQMQGRNFMFVVEQWAQVGMIQHCCGCAWRPPTITVLTERLEVVDFLLCTFFIALLFLVALVMRHLPVQISDASHVLMRRQVHWLSICETVQHRFLGLLAPDSRIERNATAQTQGGSIRHPPQM